MWKSLSRIKKFSIISFLISFVLGFLSMGALGYALYYLVTPVLGDRIDELQGDVLWPSTILAGMIFSPAFLLALWIHNLVIRLKLHPIINYFIYVAIVWLWLLMVWYSIIQFRIVS